MTINTLAQIKLPIIATLNKQYQLSQGNPVMNLSDVVTPVIDLHKYTTFIKRYSAVAFGVSSTGIYGSTIQPVIITKRCRLIAIDLKKAGGTFTTTWFNFFILPNGFTGSGVVIYKDSYDLTTSSIGIVPNSQIMLSPGDQVYAQFNVSAYTSVGNVTMSVLVEEWE